MSDSQEKHPDQQSDTQAVAAPASGADPSARGGDHERLAALDALDSARKQLLAAQEQMNAAQDRLNAIEQGRPAPEPAAREEATPASLAALPGQEHKPESDSAATPPADAKAKAQPEKVERLGVMNGFFNFFVHLGPISILIFMACMAWPIFFPFANLNYCPAELDTITAWLRMMATGNWLAPTGLEHGAWTAAQWPIISWCIALISLIPGLAGSELLLPVVAFGCAFALVFAVWCLTLATGFGARAAMAAALILLCAPVFAPMPHFVGPAGLAAACMLFALMFFYRGWVGKAGWVELPLAYAFTALAGLTAGILPLAVPLIASVCFLIWRGDLWRIYRLDAIFGFVIMLAILGVWVGLVSAEGQQDYLEALMASSWSWDLPMPFKWLLPIVAGVLGLMPWVLLIFGVSWARVLAKSARSFSASRHENGSAMIWISLVLALCLSPFIPWFHPAAIVIAALLAILLGKAFMRLPHLGNCFFFLLASLAAIIAGILIVMASFPTSQRLLFRFLPELPVPDLGARLLELQTLPIMGGILLIGGLVALFFVKRCRGAGGLFYAMLLVILLCQPARLLLVPELAKMTGTPLVSYKTIEAQVVDAMLPPAAITPEMTVPGLPEPTGALPQEGLLPEANSDAAQTPALPREPLTGQDEPQALPGEPPSRSGVIAPSLGDEKNAGPAREEVIIIEKITPPAGEEGAGGNRGAGEQDSSR